MRKKYLSALLFGALLMTSAGTFTSCKDYDDEINDLQEQIDKLATKEDMEAKLTQMQTAIDEAKKAAEESKETAEKALEAANNAGSTEEVAKLKEEIASLTERIESLEAAKIDINELKAEIESMVEGEVKEQLDVLNEKISSIEKKVEDLTGYTLQMVTSVDIQENSKAGFDTHLDLNYSRIEKVTLPNGKTTTSYKFGEGLSGEFTVAKDQVYTIKDYMLASIAPVNAVVSDDMVSLQDSKGDNINKYVTYTAEDYNELLTRSTSNGLRKIGVQLKNDVDFEEFHKVVRGWPEEGPVPPTDWKEYVAYALGVSDIEKGRTVTSTYEMEINVDVEEPAQEINKNSYISSEAGLFTQTIDQYSYAQDRPAEYWEENAYVTKLGAPLYIKVGSKFDTDTPWDKGGRVMASYVVVDYNNSNLSNTDKAAIKTLSFTGDFDKVLNNNVFELVISGSNSGIVVPLKLTTIDYTGVIEEHVIWVKASEEKVAAQAKYTVTPEYYVSNPKQYVPTSAISEFKVPTNASTFSLDMTIGEANHTDANVITVNKASIGSLTNYFTFFSDAACTNNVAWNKASYAKFTHVVNLNAMKEGTTYTGKVNFYDANGTYISTIQIDITKVLPTVAPSYLSFKTNALNGNVLTVYPEPYNGKGVFNMDKAFNGIDNSDIINFEFTSSAIGNNAVLGMTQISNINPAIIGSDKTFASKIQYNYGKIEYQPVGVGVPTIEDYKVTFKEFELKFGCLPQDTKIAWTVEPTVYYKEKAIVCPLIDEEKHTYANFIKATDPYGLNINVFDSNKKDNELDWSVWAPWMLTSNGVTVELVTNGDKVNEFFTATIKEVSRDIEGNWLAGNVYGLVLEPTSSEVVLTGDVKTTVNIKFNDILGHSVVKTLEFTMKKDRN